MHTKRDLEINSIRACSVNTYARTLSSIDVPTMVRFAYGCNFVKFFRIRYSLLKVLNRFKRSIGGALFYKNATLENKRMKNVARQVGDNLISYTYVKIL